MEKLRIEVNHHFRQNHWSFRPSLIGPLKIGKSQRVRFSLLLPVLLLLAGTSCLYNPPPFDEGKWRSEIADQTVEGLYAPHFKEGRFFNPWMPQPEEGFGRLLAWRFSRKALYSEEENTHLPKIIPNLKERIQAWPEGDFLVWIGHATFLFRIQGEYWLTDPMFSDRALLPKRKTPPAITAREIGEITNRVQVLLSHNHYDHLDKRSLKDLPKNTSLFVPLGLGRLIKKLGKDRVLEMDWWQTAEAEKGTKIQFLPAQHWSRRISQGANKSLWGSFMINTPTKTIYYGGDSGYFIGYKEIRRKNPKIDYALLPTTAYHPRWFMHYAHMDIKEALAAFQDLQARFFIPTQSGTFRLGDDPAGYPILDLNKQIKSPQQDPSRFIILDIGQILPLESKP